MIKKIQGLLLGLTTIFQLQANNSCCAKLPPRIQLDLPPGMIWLNGGEFVMGGHGSQVRADELPLHTVKLTGFYMSQTPVTNREFAEFVRATNYVTTAEKAPVLSELMAQLPPGTPPIDPSLLVASSLVFTQPTTPVDLKSYPTWWRWQAQAHWKQPQGPGSNLNGKEDHPVVHVSWFDAQAYCQWQGGDLPTEAQWEFAARGGLKEALYTWGDESPHQKPDRLNIWQGEFPLKNSGEDGYLGTSPVKAFPPNGYGLYDLSGNTWEWCRDWYDYNYYQTQTNNPLDPVGPQKSWDPDEPSVPKKVTRGGSFLCNDSYCAGYRPSARMKTSPDTSLEHTGFRMVMTQAQWQAKQLKKSTAPTSKTPKN